MEWLRSADHQKKQPTIIGFKDWNKAVAVKKISLVVVSTLLFSTTAFALPLGYGSSVTTYSQNVWPEQSGNVLPCGTSDCTNPDLVLSEHSTQYYGAGSDGLDNYIHTRRYGYESADHGVKTPGTLAAPLGYTAVEGRSRASNHGYADAGANKMGVASGAYSHGAGPLTTAHTTAEIGNKLVVSAGTSGLQDGDTVRMSMNLRLDGLVKTSATSYPYDSYAGSNMWASFKVVGNNENGAPNYDDPLMVFGADMEMSAGDVYSPYWGHSYSADMDQSYWARSNTGENISFFDSSHHEEQDLATKYLESFMFDTGLLTIEFDAVIGAELWFLGYLETWASAAGDATALTDFSHTFGSNVFSTIAGTELKWLIPDTSGIPVDVPEPGTLSLTLLGLAALWGRRRAYRLC